MGCRLIQNIQHSNEYNPGGIREIALIDINDFIAYQFKEDGLYTECYVESLKLVARNYIHLDVVTESNFTEKNATTTYEQELRTYIRQLDHQKTASLLKAQANNYVVIFRTYDNRAFTFGSDGGVALSFTQQTGQLGDSSGYDITLSKRSLYPLFEIDSTYSVNNAKRFDKFFDQFFD